MIKITSANLIVVFFLVGCATTRTVGINDLNSSDDYDLKLYLNDGRIIHYNSSEFDIDSTVSPKAVKGTGMVIADKLGSRNYSISNTILYSTIDSIQIIEYSSVSKGVGLGITVAGSASVALIILYVLFGPKSIG